MSYDIFCYRPTCAAPDEDDADRAIESDDNKWSNAPDESETKLAISKALKACDSRLVALDYEFGEIANLSVEVLKNHPARFHHIEINSSDNELPVRLTIYNNHVWINFPYWHSGSKAVRLLEEIKKYIIVIKKTAGYFVFDPQLGQVFDPDVSLPDFLNTYEKTMDLVKDYAEKNDYKSPIKKPWWKFW